MSSRYRTQTSRLNPGESPPPSYGAVLHDDDQPSTPHPTDRPFKERIIISRGLVVCFAIILLQTVLIICRSDTLAKFYDLESAANRASREKSALAAERKLWKLEEGKLERERDKMRDDRELWEHEREGMRYDMELLEQERGKLEEEREGMREDRGSWKRGREKLRFDRELWEQEREKMRCDRELWEQERVGLKQEREGMINDRELWEQERGRSEREREKLRHERELWERARDDRVPQGAFWDVISPAPDCRAYGEREFSATLQNTPEGWNAIDACMNLPVEIHGVTIRRPYRCEFVDGSPRGYWMVDWDQPDCRPWWYDYQDAGCTSYKSGRRRIEAQLVGINDKEEQNWWLLCNSTPLIWNLISYTSPTHCQERDWGRKFGMWDVPDDSCL